MMMSRVSSVGLATGYGLEYRMIGVRFQEGAGNFSLRHLVQIVSGANPASCPMGTQGSFPGGVKLTTHFHLVPRLKSYTSTPQYVFMTWYVAKYRTGYMSMMKPRKLS
jgi:hypothetical protein